MDLAGGTDAAVERVAREGGDQPGDEPDQRADESGGGG